MDGKTKQTYINTLRSVKMLTKEYLKDHYIDAYFIDEERKNIEILTTSEDSKKVIPTIIPFDEKNDMFQSLKTVVAVDDLHERGGSSNIIHLHGELTKARGSLYNHKPSPFDEVYDIGYSDINIGDKCKVSGTQLRPHIVWFGEYPFRVDEAYSAFLSADIVIIVGTSLQIGYTLSFFDNLPKGFNVIYIDPNPSHDFVNFNSKKEIKDVVIYSVLGSEINNYKVENNKIDIRNLNSGLYLLRFLLENGNQVTKKMIIKK